MQKGTVCLADLCGALHCDYYDSMLTSKHKKATCKPAVADRNRHACEVGETPYVCCFPPFWMFWTSFDVRSFCLLRWQLLRCANYLFYSQDPCKHIELSNRVLEASCWVPFFFLWNILFSIFCSMDIFWMWRYIPICMAPLDGKWFKVERHHIGLHLSPEEQLYLCGPIHGQISKILLGLVYLVDF